MATSKYIVGGGYIKVIQNLSPVGTQRVLLFFARTLYERMEELS